MTKKVEIQIKDMSCEGCVKAVEKSLLEIKGVKNVLVSLNKKKAFAEIPDNVTKGYLEYKIKEAGYTSEKIILK